MYESRLFPLLKDYTCPTLHFRFFIVCTTNGRTKRLILAFRLFKKSLPLSEKKMFNKLFSKNIRGDLVNMITTNFQALVCSYIKTKIKKQTMKSSYRIS